ncbi:cytochrome P450 [Pullulanibacillus sp. KACC 23026]|uniref:cytochrome P450 n=1 Tax=Pullulanibacillus sp. KACC 23026 TaxID=3028315 RepID=UPI0023AEEB52|nr:cytochrome P450 [Pullulanibacillus sp. KACC 23026]WEG10883.1 cytochrome P450 [Pullulanibacillus sp. KACC 23026]
MTDSLPHEEGFDHTFDLLREGYLFALNRRKSFNSDVFSTRLFGKDVICMNGTEAARLFYDSEKFERHGAAPNRVIQTLFGKNGVQTLDGNRHTHRKELFMSIMSPSSRRKLSEIAREEWGKAVQKWERMEQVTFYTEVQELLGRTASRWVGVPISESEINELTNDLAAMFESPAVIGPKHWKGRKARNRLEGWLVAIISQVREKKLHAPSDTALYQFVWHQDLEGKLLEPKVAAVELLNILRPIVAISIFINFTLLAIHHYPDEKTKLEMGDEADANRFIQEVRRYYPFFPMVGALVKVDFVWKNYPFKKGTLTLLDLYGTNHDPNIWDEPDAFKPERFFNWQDDLFSFIPQGGGDYVSGHRCAGEWVTIDIMKISLDHLVSYMDFDIAPDQDLSYSMVNIPSIPHSRLILKNVRRKES